MPDQQQSASRSDVTLRMTRKRALELGLLICECGWPENNHFDHGSRPCAHSTCKAYRERGVSGTTVVSELRTIEPIGYYRFLSWSTDSQNRPIALIGGTRFEHEDAKRLRDELIALLSERLDETKGEKHG